MAAKKTKTITKSKKTPSKKSKNKSPKSKTKGKKSNKSNLSGDDMGIVVIDEDIQVNKDAELEARRAYLEEARSQEATD